MGFWLHLGLGPSLECMEKGPSQPSVLKLKVPQFLHLCPPPQITLILNGHA